MTKHEAIGILVMFVGDNAGNYTDPCVLNALDAIVTLIAPHVCLCLPGAGVPPLIDCPVHGGRAPFEMR